MDSSIATQIKKAPVRVWVDGCFDMMHFGHANALRQAKELGDYLIVGVHSDVEIEKNKGPCVMHEDERYIAVSACKWVDQVVKDAPYVTSLEVLQKYNVDFVVHGDDITTAADGTDCYQEVKDAGKYKEVKRTEGVSTTEIVGRMLLFTKDHLQLTSKTDDSLNIDNSKMSDFSKDNVLDRNTGVHHYLSTSKKIVQFSSGKEPKKGDRVVYVDGGFDLFHAGHIEFLKKAKEQGDFLLVGIHDDRTVNRVKGGSFPVMNLQERVLGVLQCRYVDEVIIGAPYSVTSDVLNSVYKVGVVAHGPDMPTLDLNGSDPYSLPKELGIYKQVDHNLSSLTTSSIIERVIESRQRYIDRQKRKMEKAKLESQLELQKSE
ncbi:Ethanolamine-phosphate cytidylyltransferase [Smittium mucronatum]|uniref:ethanolamine-phosphate cytidylyltransferase n=1 Tax=Smittium mucronatum TaxID=133383 RepID=A0A1R0H213_9FUNG|nr:Ethanolamine-phosphate cytidylyltransferase [Smittium mucronatum]